MARVPTLALIPVAIPVFFASLAAGCAAPTVPDPRTTASEFAAAARAGDAARVRALLTPEGQRAYGVEDVKKRLADESTEMVRLGKAAASPDAIVRTVAELTYVDGEHATLTVENGAYRISAAAGLPSGARTPADALDELRGALARRSYAALVRVLSSETRGVLESDMKSLVQGLEHPDSLDVRVRGETAEVEIPGGHKVVLKREAGVWRIQDFD